MRPALAAVNTNGAIMQSMTSALQVNDVVVIVLEYMRN